MQFLNSFKKQKFSVIFFFVFWANLCSGSTHLKKFGFGRVEFLPQENCSLYEISEKNQLKFIEIFETFALDFPEAKAFLGATFLEWSCWDTWDTFSTPVYSLKINNSDFAQEQKIQKKLAGFYIPKIISFYAKEKFGFEELLKIPSLENSWIRFVFAELYVDDPNTLKTENYENEILWALDYGENLEGPQKEAFIESVYSESLVQNSTRLGPSVASKVGFAALIAKDLKTQGIPLKDILRNIVKKLQENPKSFLEKMSVTPFPFDGNLASDPPKVDFIDEFSFYSLFPIFKELGLEVSDKTMASILKNEIQWVTRRFRFYHHGEFLCRTSRNAFHWIRPEFPQTMPAEIQDKVRPHEANLIPSRKHVYQVERTLKDYKEHLHWEFSEFLENKKNSRVHWIDMGSGEGFAVEEWVQSKPNGPEQKFTATGLTLEMKRQNPKIPGLEFKVGKFFQEIPLNEIPKADLITDLHGVMAYSPDIDNVLSRYLQILKDDGFIFVFLNSQQFVKLKNGKVLTLSEWIESLPGLDVSVGKSEYFRIKIKSRNRVSIPKVVLKFSDAESPPRRFFVEDAH